MKSIEKACRYTRVLFVQTYSESPSVMESLLKDFRDTAKRSADYGPATMEPFINSFVFFMRFDVREKTIHLRRIFEAIRPVIIRAMRSDQDETIENYFEKLFGLEESIKDNQNFRAARIYVIALRETFQDLLRYETKEKDRFVWTIFHLIKNVFSDFSKFSEIEIHEGGGNRLDILCKIIGESLNVGYNLIVQNELYFFNSYLDMLERMYLDIDRIKDSDYFTSEHYESRTEESPKRIRPTLKNEFFLLLFRLGVFALTKNKHEFVARILSRDETDEHIVDVGKKLHEDFIGKFEPEKHCMWALRNLIRVFGPIGEIARKRDVIQFYLLIRSRALFEQLRNTNRGVWHYPSSKLRKTLEEDSEWIFFEKEVPEEHSSEWKKVSFVSDFIKKIRSLNVRDIKAKGCQDFPDYLRIIKIFGMSKDLFQQVTEDFTNNDEISRKAFGGALEQFLEITIRFLERVNEVWEEEKERIERSFPIVEERRERAIESIKEALNEKSVFRKAVEWKESNELMMQETEKLGEVLLRKKINTVFLKDLPIIAFFDNFGNISARKEDMEILSIIERNIEKEKASFVINVETISKFLGKLECDTLIMITGRQIGKDFSDSGEIQHLRCIDSVYEVSIDGRIIAFIYWSYVFRNKTLIFAKDQFLEIFYLEKENIEIRYPEECELSEGDIKEDFQMILISQVRGLKFLDITKAFIIEHELLNGE
jgi:hypothetical protein